MTHPNSYVAYMADSQCGQRERALEHSWGASTLEKHLNRWFTLSGLPWWLSGKESAHSAGDTVEMWLQSWVGKIPWRRKWLPLQCSCLENPMDRGAWGLTVHGVSKSRTGLSTRLHCPKCFCMEGGHPILAGCLMNMTYKRLCSCGGKYP